MQRYILRGNVGTIASSICWYLNKSHNASRQRQSVTVACTLCDCMGLSSKFLKYFPPDSYYFVHKDSGSIPTRFFPAKMSIQRYILLQ